MGLDKIIDRIEDKIEEYEENMDDDVPPWYGKDEDSGESKVEEPTKTKSQGDSFELQEGDNQITILVKLPGVPEDNIELKSDGDSLYIEIEETDNFDERKYEYELPEDADVQSISADYNNGLLEVTVDRE